MAGYAPNLSPVFPDQETCGEILDGISAKSVSRAVLNLNLDPNPELDEWRMAIIAGVVSPGERYDIRVAPPYTLAGVGFDAGRYMLCVSGVPIPRFPHINFRYFQSISTYIEVDDAYSRAASDWSADYCEEAADRELVEFGFDALYRAVVILRLESTKAYN